MRRVFKIFDIILFLKRSYATKERACKSNIYKDAVIGNNCNIGTLVEIRNDVIIGNNCKIQSFVFIPEGVIIGDNVFIGPHVCFTNDKYPSVKGYGKFMSTFIGDNVDIGAGAIIICGIAIGEGAMIGAGAVVTKNVMSYSTVVGNPARVKR